MSERHFTVAEASTKQHAELVSSSNYQYCVHMGGTRDGFNTADYIETYGGATRYTPGFEPNRSVTIENRGTSETRNPRLVVNNRRSWFSVEHILRSVISPGMSDFETVMAIFRFSSDIFLQAHDNDRRPGPLYPNEATNPSANAFKERADPVKGANLYYCSGCQFGASNFVILCRAAGLAARAIWMCALDDFNCHCIAEVFYDGSWHLFDPDRRQFFLEEDNCTVASYESLHRNPGLEERVHSGGFSSEEGKASHKDDYREFYPPREMPTDQWLSDMSYSLRPGEKIIFNWGHEDKFHYGLNPRHKGQAPYMLSNGKMIYTPDFGNLASRWGCLTSNNCILRDTKGSFSVHPERAHVPGTIIYKMTSAYPIVGGTVHASVDRHDSAAEATLALSYAEKDWVDLGKPSDADAPIAFDHLLNLKEDLAPYVIYLRIILQPGANPDDISLTAIRISIDLQMAETSLPALSCGDNTVAYTDDSLRPGKVLITHCWAENSDAPKPMHPEATVPPSSPAQTGRSLLEWVALDTPVETYHVQVSPRKDMLYPVSPSLDRFTFSNIASWEIPQGWLIHGRTYYWRVRAKAASGIWSDWSDVWEISA